jgi:hypothetical protein
MHDLGVVLTSNDGAFWPVAKATLGSSAATARKNKQLNTVRAQKMEISCLDFEVFTGKQLSLVSRA